MAAVRHQLGLAGRRDHDDARPNTSATGTTSDAAALEVSLKAGVCPREGRRAVARGARSAYPGLQVRTRSEREAQSNASAREGLRTLGEISTLLLIAAALCRWRRR